MGGDAPASPIPAEDFPHKRAVNCAIRTWIVPYDFHNCPLNLAYLSQQILKRKGCSIRSYISGVAASESLPSTGSGARRDYFQVLCLNYSQLVARTIMC